MLKHEPTGSGLRLKHSFDLRFGNSLKFWPPATLSRCEHKEFQLKTPSLPSKPCTYPYTSLFQPFTAGKPNPSSLGHWLRHSELEFAGESQFQTIDNPKGKEGLGSLPLLVTLARSTRLCPCKRDGSSKRINIAVNCRRPISSSSSKRPGKAQAKRQGRQGRNPEAKALKPSRPSLNQKPLSLNPEPPKL